MTACVFIVILPKNSVVKPAEIQVEAKQTAPEKTEREAWLEKLIACESGGRPEAINPKDRDGTPSYGLLQFKPDTFAGYLKKYLLQGELMDPEKQKQIVRLMMDDKDVVWETLHRIVTGKQIGRAHV